MIVFFVPSEPRPKQSFRVAGRGRGFTPARIKAWQSEVGWAALQAMRQIEMLDPLEGHLTVEMIFFLGNARRTDLDNLSKAIQDGLNKIAWLDDQQNIRLVQDKYICRAKQGVLVKISENHRALEISEAEMDVIIENSQSDDDQEDINPYLLSGSELKRTEAIYRSR